MSRLSLSVVLATYNEENNIAECLKSIKDIADEIIIVDGSSNDKTVEIARQFKAKVTVTDNPANFHINKQKAIDQATCDWILQLDADERVSIGLAKEIIKIINRNQIDPRFHGDNHINGYWISRKNWFLGRFLMKGGQYPDYTLRLYKKGKGRLPQIDVHEQAVVDGETEYLKNPLIHIADPELKRYLMRFDRYTNLIARDLREKNVGSNPLLAIKYLLFLPVWWFLLTYFRHKGFLDSWQGFVFSFFSALRFPMAYLKSLRKYHYAMLLIIVLATFLRFYHFSSRWGLGGDDARDVMIALEALRRHEIPIFGSFSSAGPFVIGPIFYWLMMLSYIVMPFTLSAPWVVIATAGIITVILLAYCGKLIAGEKLGLITGLLAATSPQLVTRSLMLGNPSYIPVFSTLLILSFILLIKYKKIIFAVFIGLSLGLALNMHYQAINLFIFFPAVLFIKHFSLKNKIKALLVMCFGFLIPMLPILIWDARQGFANILNILDYLLIAQNRIYVPNSWKLFIFKYLPDYWAFVVGNYSIIGLFLIFIIGVEFIISITRKKISNVLLILGLIFFILLVVIRYYKGERSEGYLLYFLPLIILFTGWAIELLITKNSLFKNKYFNSISIFFGIATMIMVIGSNIFGIIKHTYMFKSPVGEYQRVARNLLKKYPNRKFLVYDYKFQAYELSTGLALILENQGLINKNGIPIGVGCRWEKCSTGLRVATVIYGNPIYDLRYIKNFPEYNTTWGNSNRQTVYDGLITKWKNEKLISSFSLKQYIINRLKL
jgi:glycosyltransferase involved in cell wall biosynthesis